MLLAAKVGSKLAKPLLKKASKRLVKSASKRLAKSASKSLSRSSSRSSSRNRHNNDYNDDEQYEQVTHSNNMGIILAIPILIIGFFMYSKYFIVQ